MLLDKFSTRKLQLANHMVMAPPTSSRATPEHLPNTLMATHHGQWATAGLVSLQPHSMPRAMSETDIAHAVKEHADAATPALDAGFDGVELHGANGCLIERRAAGACRLQARVARRLRRFLHPLQRLRPCQRRTDIDRKTRDLIAFGRPFLANPELVARMQTNAALYPPDRPTFYTPGAKGYTDWPCLPT